jgi:hypothetical protein
MRWDCGNACVSAVVEDGAGMHFPEVPDGQDFPSMIAEAKQALADGDCMKAYAAVLLAAALAPMNDKVTRLAVAVSASAMQQGNTTLADLTQLMLSARSQVLTEMIPGRQQIGAGCGHPGPSAEVMAGDSLFSEWVLFWQKAFRVAVMKDLN